MAIGVVVPVAVIAAVVVAAVVVANGKRGRRGDPAGRCAQLHVLGTPTGTGSVEHSGDGVDPGSGLELREVAADSARNGVTSTV